MEFDFTVEVRVSEAERLKTYDDGHGPFPGVY